MQNDIQKLQNRIQLLFEKLDLVRDQAKEAYTLSQYAARGYVELSSEIKSVQKIQEHILNSMTNIDAELKRQEGLSIELNQRLNRNMKWTVGTIITLFFGFLGIIITLIRLLGSGP